MSRAPHPARAAASGRYKPGRGQAAWYQPSSIHRSPPFAAESPDTPDYEVPGRPVHPAAGPDGDLLASEPKPLSGRVYGRGRLSWLAVAITAGQPISRADPTGWLKEITVGRTMKAALAVARTADW